MSRRPLSAAVLALSSLLIAVPAVAQDLTTHVQVRESGDEPLTELRYAWSEGLSGTTVVDADTTITAMANGVTVSEEQAALQKIVTRAVTEIDGDGNARVEFTVDAPERQLMDIPAAEAVPGDGVEALQAEIAALSDYSGWMLLDPRGVLLDFGVEGISDASAVFLAQTRGLGGEVMVLPEEPVGTGAEWETYTEIFERSLTFEAETLTTLTAFDGNVLTLEQETSVSQEPDLGLERLAISAGAVYMSQQLEGTASTVLPLDGLVQSGTGEVELTFITGAAAGTGGTELQTDYVMTLVSSAGE